MLRRETLSRKDVKSNIDAKPSLLETNVKREYIFDAIKRFKNELWIPKLYQQSRLLNKINPFNKNIIKASLKDALIHDGELINEFESKIKDDYDFLCGEKMYSEGFEFKSLKKNNYNFKTLNKDIDNHLLESLNFPLKTANVYYSDYNNKWNIYAGIKNEIKWGWVRRRSNKVTITFGKNDMLYEMAYIDTSLKDPDDFTRSMPIHAEKTLERLKKTNFDYKPKILDGFLLYLGPKMITKQELKYDPAIVIRDFSNKFYIALDAWKEPFDKYQRSIMDNYSTTVKGL